MKTSRGFTFISLASTLLALTSCSHKRNLTYRAAIRYIPDSADPYSTEVDTDSFIMIQLYYPLFQKDEDGTLTSEFLDLSKTHADDSQFKNFTLCLRSDARFSDGSPIATADLQHSLGEAHKRQELLSPLESIRSDGGCVHVSLKSSDPRYFEKLTGIASTVTSQKVSVGGFPLGLGHYHVASHTPDRLILEADPGRISGSFTKIEYQKLTDVGTDYLNGVFDFNHAGQVSIPPRIEKDFQHVSRPFYKSYALVVNYPDPNLRKRLSSCFPMSEFVPLIGIPLKKIPGFLPLGIQGSDSVTPLPETQSPALCKRTSASPITFFNYRPEINKTLRDFFETHGKSLPIPIRYENGTLNELVQRVFHDNRFMAVIGFDSSTSDSSAYAEAATFFESFIRSARAERLISQPIPGLADIVRTAARTSDSSLKADTYRRGHQLLLNSGYVIPMGQFDVDQLYPKGIHRIVWSDRISGFPDISQMESTQ